jgi:hypothetical protein
VKRIADSLCGLRARVLESGPCQAFSHPCYAARSLPQFVFLDASGKPLAAAVGKLPREVLTANSRALAEGQPLPYARVQADGASSLQRPEGAMTGPRQSGPLDHF